MRCEICHGDGGWWLDREGKRLPFRKLHKAVGWRQCLDCVGGVSSCCDGAAGAQQEGDDALCKSS
jgi:hypothetical protein